MSDTVTPRQWMVTLSMPIEAAEQTAAAADFWEYIRALGPDELPVFHISVRRRVVHAGVCRRRGDRFGPGRGGLVTFP